MENLIRFYLKDLISHGTPVHWFFQVVYPLFFSCELCFPRFTFTHAFVFITEKLIFPVHPFQFQLMWNRYKT